RQQNGQPVHKRRSRELKSHGRHQPKRSGVDSVKKCAGHWRTTNARHERTADGDEEKSWKKNSDSGDERGKRSTQNVTDECRGGENRAGSDLSDRYSVQQLRFNEAHKTVNQSRRQKCDK